MKREFDLYLSDILKSIEKIESYINDDSFDEFVKKDIVIDAVLNNLLIIGEASSQLQENIKVKYTNILWREIIGFRNVAIHRYHSLNLKRVWSIIEEKLPKLKDDIQEILKKEKKIN